MLSSTVTRGVCVSAALTLALGLSACSSKDDEPETPTTPASETTETSESSSEPTETTETSESTETTSNSRWRGGGEDKLEEVRGAFASLAPESLFDALDTCTETSLRHSYDCSGADIGQFQFFESEAMAKDTANVLEGLKSSTIVQETEDKLVGWSMIGRTAVITVVDVADGKVMQQMMSSEVEDPRERIFELGLAEKKRENTTPTTSEETPTTSKEAS